MRNVGGTVNAFLVLVVLFGAIVAVSTLIGLATQRHGASGRYRAGHGGGDPFGPHNSHLWAPHSDYGHPVGYHGDHRAHSDHWSGHSGYEAGGPSSGHGGGSFSSGHGGGGSSGGYDGGSSFGGGYDASSSFSGGGFGGGGFSGGSDSGGSSSSGS
jgi:hypothetical protein